MRKSFTAIATVLRVMEWGRRKLRELPIALAAGQSARRDRHLQLRGSQVRPAFGHAHGTSTPTLSDLIVVPTNMEKYRAESKRVQSIFYEYTTW